MQFSRNLQGKRRSREFKNSFYKEDVRRETTQRQQHRENNAEQTTSLYASLALHSQSMELTPTRLLPPAGQSSDGQHLCDWLMNIFFSDVQDQHLLYFLSIMTYFSNRLPRELGMDARLSIGNIYGAGVRESNNCLLFFARAMREIW